MAARSQAHLAGLIVLLMVLFPRDVDAYLDPGTGSLVFQAMVAGLAAGAYTIRMYWSRLRRLFGRSDAQRSVQIERSN